MAETKANPLLGRTLRGVYVSKDRTALRFMLDDGEVMAVCDADCCSYTWIEGVEAPSLPARVLAVENIDMPTAAPARGEHGPESTDSVEFYGLRVVTDQGHLVIDYRNDSNGYYGGSILWPGEYGGVYGQNATHPTDWGCVACARGEEG